MSHEILFQITDERRIQLNEYKAKAIDIEKRIKRKRASIDSGVMTGSYIDNFKNSDTLPAESSTAHELSSSNITLVENLCVNDKLSSECDSKDSFLTLALEDSEFRAFFYSTAERIFKDNNVPNENNISCCDSSVLSENHNPVEKDSYTKENNSKQVMKDSQITLLTGEHAQASNILHLEVSDHVDLTSCNDERNEINKLQGNTNVPCREVVDKISPPERRVRRNSYTLDSPSPVLLEHMAKGNTPIGKSLEYWQVFPENKDKGLGFKTFLDSKKQRKTWNKNSNIYSPPKLEVITNTKVPDCLLKKSNTFIKPDKEYKHSIYSLPCSSRSSPTKLSTFAYSSDCIQSVYKNSLGSENGYELNTSNALKQNTEINVLHQSEIPVNCDNEINVTEKTSESTLEDFASVTDKTSVLPLEVYANAMPNNLPIRNVSHSPNYETLVLYPPSHVVSGNSTSSTCVNESLLIQQNTDFNALTESKRLENKKETSNDIMDDSLSVCSSSLSLSKFMPTDDHLSRPSTAEDLSALFSELQLRHDRQIAELLEMQHKEKILLSKLHSNCGSISSRSPVNISVSEFSCNSALNTEQIVNRTPCSRELFPSASPIPPKESKYIDYQHHNSESVKVKINFKILFIILFCKMCILSLSSLVICCLGL